MSEDKLILLEECEKDCKAAHGMGLYTGAIMGFIVGILTMILIFRMG